jgi:hypothetical protein
VRSRRGRAARRSRGSVPPCRRRPWLGGGPGRRPAVSAHRDRYRRVPVGTAGSAGDAGVERAPPPGVPRLSAGGWGSPVQGRLPAFRHEALGRQPPRPGRRRARPRRPPGGRRAHTVQPPEGPTVFRKAWAPSMACGPGVKKVPATAADRRGAARNDTISPRQACGGGSAAAGLPRTPPLSAPTAMGAQATRFTGDLLCRALGPPPHPGGRQDEPREVGGRSTSTRPRISRNPRARRTSRPPGSPEGRDLGEAGPPAPSSARSRLLDPPRPNLPLPPRSPHRGVMGR